jgi:hypothetical protein
VHSESMGNLPPGYRQTAEFNLRNNTRMMLMLNGVGFILFLVAAALVPLYIQFVRPMESAGSFSFSIDNMGQAGLVLLYLLIDFALLVFLHEGVHGICFWLITRKRPIFAIGPGYAYAAAPGVYLKKRPYLVTALSPLVILTIAGMAAILIIPEGLIFHAALIIVMNIAGAVGDLWVAGMLLLKSEPLLVHDSGDKVVVFQPE